MKSLRVR